MSMLAFMFISGWEAGDANAMAQQMIIHYLYYKILLSLFYMQLMSTSFYSSTWFLLNHNFSNLYLIMQQSSILPNDHIFVIHILMK